jgi:NitT/TauT family transport system substrate-binding protein
LGAILLVGGLYFWAQSQPEQPKTDSPKSEKSFFGKLFGNDDKKDDDNIIKIGTNTFAGFNYLMWLNRGLEPNKDCPFFQMTGCMAKIIVQDDFPAGRAAFINDDINLLYCTVDAFPTEMSEGSEMAKVGAKYIFLSNWSRGADAIVATKRIRNVGDLIGKVVACSQGTASHTLLLNTLEANGIGSDRVHLGEGVDKNKVNIKVVENGLEAASTFKSGQCDAAVVYSPDDVDIVNSMDAWVLVSTKQASNIICDGLIAKQEYIDKNREKLEKVIAAFLTANVKMNTDDAAVKEASKYFAKSYGTDEPSVGQE